ncbi:sugar transferase [Mobilicoccus caccae]|uniref:Bacterial sugar transferase domain-containing protein n=1 Tax=Mobilicoccus caccae TaxID=1859295 RepID=A0ABQ6IPR0_9MICO|nr:sugar transferase [Mobilicoccus caccae]GMA38673.1 hypothetical protein GCM10025883_07180 [Mobilicoccus caccae]
MPATPGYARAKRAVDVVVSAAGLVATGPLLGVLAAAVRVDSPGPVFFRQTRVGLGGEEFRIHKFRTMHVATAGRRASPSPPPATPASRGPGACCVGPSWMSCPSSSTC